MRASMQKSTSPVQHRAKAPSSSAQHENDVAQSPRVVMQRKAMGDGFGGASAPVGGGSGGLPGNLTRGIAALSGMDVSDVSVFRNSSRPAQFKALALAQDNAIHLAPGQEKHLPHEAWHIVQQRQGRVKATLQEKGVGINDEPGLEREATVMGERAMSVAPFRAADVQDGNAVANAGARKSPAEPARMNVPMQRYKAYSNGIESWHFSENHEIVLKADPHTPIEAAGDTLYATDAVLNASNSKLTAVKSALVLKGAEAHDLEGKKLKRVMVTWKPSINRGPATVEDHQFVSIDQARKQDSSLLWADCSKSSAEVSGSKSANRMADLVVLNKQQSKGGAKPGRKMDGLSSGEVESSAAQFANTVYIEMLENFITASIRAHKNFLLPGYHCRVTPGSRRITALKLGAEKTYASTQELKMAGFAPDVPLKPGPRARTIYEKLGSIGRDEFDKYAGINRYANPDVGETFAMATEYMMPGSAPMNNRSRWVYHYAGVIMVDGSDRVTLENYSVSDDKVANQDWHFAMYGTQEDETFHEKHLGTGTHGTKATSMRIRTKI